MKKLLIVALFVALTAAYCLPAHLRPQNFLKEKNISYWFGPYVSVGTVNSRDFRISRTTDGCIVEVFSPLYRKSAGTFRLRDEDLIVRIRDIVRYPEAEDAGIWRLRVDSNGHS